MAASTALCVVVAFWNSEEVTRFEENLEELR